MKKELEAFREIMKQEKIDLFFTKDADDHISEYNDRYFSAMEFLSGFTGGDGTLVITQQEACLWTDGRYFIQAAAELEGSGILLMKEGEPDCPVMEQWIREKLPESGVLGFDGRCISWDYASKLIRSLSEKKITVRTEEDLVGRVWTEGRPAKTAGRIWRLEEKWAGMSAEQKLAELRAALKALGAGAHLISAMDETAWLLNLRGSDVPYCPVFDAFFLIDGDTSRLYVSAEHLTGGIRSYLESLGIEICEDTEQIYEDASKITSSCVLLDGYSVSYRLVRSLPEGTDLLFAPGPCQTAKNRKNPTECANLKTAQLKDSTAVTRFMYWFKKALARGAALTETGAAEKLHAFRAQEEGFLGDSFETISAWGPNAAMCHYAPSPEKPVTVEPKSLYLVDSGGHYYEGSTDITRTWSCGPTTEEERKAYTMTACANLRLADTVFPDHTSGVALDLAAREIYWKQGLDFNHGTGHGVGYLLYVHEGPASIRFKGSAYTVYDEMTEGVYLSDEPGFYAEGKFGVRLENMVLVEKAFANEFRQFMRLNALTLVPFDRDCIEVSEMNESDIALWNAYHKRVYEAIAPRLNGEERGWLAEMCAPLEN